MSVLGESSGVLGRVVQFFQLALLVALPVGNAMAADCTLDSSPDPFIRHDVTTNVSTSVSYCELCGYGYVTFVVANPFNTAWMTNINVGVDLGAAGLVYDATAPNPITVNGASTPSAAPTGAGSTLTFSNLPNLAPLPGNSAGTLSVRFAVRRTTDPEGDSISYQFDWGDGNLSEWTDFTRRGRMARNMQPAHAEVAARRGSLGVGRFYYRVRVEEGKVFDLYYDRAVKNVDDRLGHWFLYREITDGAGDE